MTAVRRYALMALVVGLVAAYAVAQVVYAVRAGSWFVWFLTVLLLGGTAAVAAHVARK